VPDVRPSRSFGTGERRNSWFYLSRPSRARRRKPAARNEMQIAFVVASLEVLWHPVDEHSHVRPIVPTSCGLGPTACDLQQRRGPQISGDEHRAPSRYSTVTSPDVILPRCSPNMKNKLEPGPPAQALKAVLACLLIQLAYMPVNNNEQTSRKRSQYRVVGRMHRANSGANPHSLIWENLRIRSDGFLDSGPHGHGL